MLLSLRFQIIHTKESIVDMLRYLSVVLIVSTSLSVDAQEVKHPSRDGTLHLLSFGVGAAIEGPPVDDLYGRDAGFIVEAVKRSPSAWRRVETKLVSGLECTPERLHQELERLVKEASQATWSLFMLVRTERPRMACCGWIASLPKFLTQTLSAKVCPNYIVLR